MSDSNPASLSPTIVQDETGSVVKAAGLISVATFFSRILGLIRDIVLAQMFGATPAADAFFIAYRIPNLLRELFAEGSMSAAFIPVFTEYQTLKAKRDTWELASAVFTTLLTLVTGITVVGVVAAPGIVWLLAPGFHDDYARLELTTLLTQIMLPYLIFVSLAALAMGILNSMRAFAAPAFSPVFFNICIIGCAVFVSPTMPEPIEGVAIGVVVGGFAQFAIQLPSLSLRGMLFGLRFEANHPGVRRIGALMVPSLLGLSVTQINITISTVLASFFVGGPTYLFYSMRLIQFPLGIFGVALATAILPTLAAQATRGSLGELRTTVGFGLRMIFFIMLPAMMGLMFLCQPIVHLVFEHGAFTAYDTAETARALFCYAVGLWAFGSIRIIVAAFYSLQDTRLPAIAAAAAVGANLVFSLMLMSSLGMAGLALATALAAMLNGGILVIALDRRLGGLEWRSVGHAFVRALLACVPLGIICGWVASAGVWTHPGEWIAKSLLLGVAMSLSIGSYLGVHAWMHSGELHLLWGAVKKKVSREVQV